MKKLINRVGSDKHKVQFDVLVHELNINFHQESQVTVTMVTHNKNIETPKAKLTNGKAVFESKLSIVISMYKDKNAWLEKKVKFWILREEPGSKKKKKLGTLKIDIAPLAGGETWIFRNSNAKKSNYEPCFLTISAEVRLVKSKGTSQMEKLLQERKEELEKRNLAKSAAELKQQSRQQEQMSHRLSYSEEQNSQFYQQQGTETMPVYNPIMQNKRSFEEETFTQPKKQSQEKYQQESYSQERYSSERQSSERSSSERYQQERQQSERFQSELKTTQQEEKPPKKVEIRKESSDNKMEELDMEQQYQRYAEENQKALKEKKKKTKDKKKKKDKSKKNNEEENLEEAISKLNQQVESQAEEDKDLEEAIKQSETKTSTKASSSSLQSLRNKKFAAQTQQDRKEQSSFERQESGLSDRKESTPSKMEESYKSTQASDRSSGEYKESVKSQPYIPTQKISDKPAQKQGIQLPQGATAERGGQTCATCACILF